MIRGKFTAGSLGRDVWPAVGALVAVKAPGVRPVGGALSPSFDLRGYAREVFGISP